MALLESEEDGGLGLSAAGSVYKEIHHNQHLHEVESSMVGIRRYNTVRQKATARLGRR